jgi:shikimate kinase
MKIFLIGLPGCGKSTLGKQLSQKLNIPFIDLDVEIERSKRMPIKEIFKKFGEPSFRKTETAMLKNISVQREEFVMATGGGTPIFFDNMIFMNNQGRTIFIDVPAREIADRISRSNLEERPLLAKLAPDELKDQIEFLRSQRINFYNQASSRVEGNSIGVEDVLGKLTSS